MNSTPIHFLVLGAAMSCVAACDGTRAPSSPEGGTPPAQTVESKSYLDRLAAFKTHLIRVGPSPQPYGSEQPPSGVQEVTYPSGTMALKAWVAFPDGASNKSKVPGVVYYHGGYGFGASDFEDARPFLEAGFAVMCPMLRGENGNPGNFELYFGEVEDAKAAIAWFATQERVNASRIYTFGHSAGGVISALLSLHAVPIRHGGSSGGLYGTSLFDHSKAEAPFQVDDPRERELRVLVGNVKWMQRKHHAFVGVGDGLQDVDSARRELREGPQLSIIKMTGDHFTSLAPAVRAYVDLIKTDP
jgi:acetyl esterase/lipase